MALNAKTVNETFQACLAVPRKHGVQRIAVRVGETRATFDKAKLLEQYPVILLMLSELPTQFHAKGPNRGRGWSMRNACLDKDGNQWTALLVEVERLLALGMAQGWVASCLHKDMLKLTKTDMPYFKVDLPVVLP